MFLVLMLQLFGLFTLTPIPLAEVAEARQTQVREFGRVRTSEVATARHLPMPASVPAVASKPAVAKSVTKPATVKLKPAASAPATTVSVASAVEIEILKLVNVERANKGLSKLEADSRLSAIARAHSADMLKGDYFSHADKNGCTSSCRAAHAGYEWRAVGENIYTIEGYDLSAKEIAAMMVKGWMESPGHRANILKEIYTNHGVGIAVSGLTVYATSLFATPK